MRDVLVKNADIHTLTMASVVWGMSVMIPSVTINSMK